MDGALGSACESHRDRRHVPLRARRWMLVVLAAATAAITLGPMPVGMLDAAHEASLWLAANLPGRWSLEPTRGETEALLNVLVSLALVVLVAAAWPAIRPFRLFVGAIAVSVTIESVQMGLPGRHPQLRDILLNSIGATIGATLVVVVRRARERRSTTVSV